MTPKILGRAIAAFVVAGALAAAAPASAIGASDTPPNDGSWISVSPKVVRCDLESQVKKVRLSWWTPPRGIYPGHEDPANRLFANGVYVDGSQVDVGRLYAGEEHSVLVPFACNRESHTYIVSNPSGYGNIKVTAKRDLRPLHDRIVKPKGDGTATKVNPKVGKDRFGSKKDRLKDCWVVICTPQVKQPIPKPKPKPKSGIGSSARVATR